VLLRERRDALRHVIQARGFQATKQHLARIDACVDPARLEVWIQGAITAKQIDDLF